MIIKGKELNKMAIFSGLKFNSIIEELAFPVYVAKEGEAVNVSKRKNVRVNGEKMEFGNNFSKEDFRLLSKGKDGNLIISKNKIVSESLSDEDEVTRIVLTDLHKFLAVEAKSKTLKEKYQDGELKVEDLNFHDNKFTKKNKAFIERMLEGNFTDIFVMEDNEEYLVIEVEGVIPHVIPTRVLMELFEERNLDFILEGKRTVEYEAFVTIYKNYLVTIVK